MCKDISMMKTVPFLSFSPSFFFTEPTHSFHIPFYVLLTLLSSLFRGCKTEERINSLYPSFFPLFLRVFLLLLCLSNNRVCTARLDLFITLITTFFSLTTIDNQETRIDMRKNSYVSLSTLFYSLKSN